MIILSKSYIYTPAGLRLGVFKHLIITALWKKIHKTSVNARFTTEA